MSSNLSFNTVATSSAQKEQAINDIIAQVDAVLTEYLTVSLLAANVTLTTAQWTRNSRFIVTGAAVAGRTLTLPAIKRWALFNVPATDTQSMTVVVGSSSVVLNPGDRYLIITDGTANGLEAWNIAGGAIPYDFGFVFSTVPGSLDVLGRVRLGRTFQCPANFAGSFGGVGAIPTASFAINVLKNGTSVGTITVATTGVVTFASAGGTAVDFAAGDEVLFIAPSTVDATVADGSFVIVGDL